MHKKSYYLVNGITFYRLIAAPGLLVLILSGYVDVFKWLLAFSFFTDAIDGYLARRYNVVSVMGAKLDSIADDLTVLVAIIGLFIWKPDFFRQEYIPMILLLILFLVQLISALLRYKKTTSFHTYLAKIAAVFQGFFLILSFFFPDPLLVLFYLAVSITALQLIEEIIMIFLLPEWKADVKSLYHAIRHKKNEI